MALVTTFCTPMRTGVGETGFQIAGEDRFVVDCNLNSPAFVRHVKITFDPEGMMMSCGGGSETLNTVQKPETPLAFAVPYRVFPDKTNPPRGKPPSLFVEGEDSGITVK